MKTVLDSCPLCAKTDWREMGVASAGGHLLQCAGCSLVRLGASASELNRDDYRGDDEQKVFPADLDRIFGTWARFRLSQLLEMKSSIGRLAEIGSGTGHFLEAAVEKGIAVRGFDLADHRTHAKQSEFEVSPDPFRSLGRSQWDAVAAFHVLEHCADPLGTVRSIVASLRPGGIGFVEVPGIVEDSPPIPSMIDPRHQWYFTEATLRRLVEKAGGEVTGLSRVGPTQPELEAGARAGEKITRGWNRLKQVLPGPCVDVLRKVARPLRSNLAGVMSKLETGAGRDATSLPLNLCIFFHAKA